MSNGRRSAILIFFFLVAVTLGAAAPARADTGIPMIMLLWPGFWMLLVPVVVLEATVARRVLVVDWKTAFRLSAEANVVSTLVGIPLTWLCLFLVEMAAGLLAYGALQLVGITNPPDWLGYALMPLAAPWIGPPSEAHMWVVPAAAIWLLIFFFFATVWIESKVVVRRSSVGESAARRWSWQANLLSYAVMEALMLGLLAWTIIVR